MLNGLQGWSVETGILTKIFRFTSTFPGN